MNESATTSQELTYDTPAMLPPPGVKSDFVDPPDYWEWQLGVTIASVTIMITCVIIRSYTKAFLMKRFQHEDYVAILALCMFLTWEGIYLYLASFGITRDLWNIRAMDMERILYLSNIIHIMYGPAMLAAKYFILITLKRIFCPPGIRGAVWWVLNILIWVNIMYYTSCFFTFLLSCIPREAIWNITVSGTCINMNDAIVVAGIVNLAIDVGVLLAPLWAIWHLQLPLKRKLGVVAVFAVGFITCGLAAAGTASRVPLMTSVNRTHAIAKVGLWTFAEFTGTIVVGCMPVMPRFYETHIKPKSKGMSTSIQATKGSNGSSVKPTSKFTVTSTFDEEAGHQVDHQWVELKDAATVPIAQAAYNENTPRYP